MDLEAERYSPEPPSQETWQLSGPLGNALSSPCLWCHSLSNPLFATMCNITLTAASIVGILIRSVSTLDDAVAHHGVEQALLPVLAHEIHVAGAQGFWRNGRSGGEELAPLLSLAAGTPPAAILHRPKRSGRILGSYRKFPGQMGRALSLRRRQEGSGHLPEHSSPQHALPVPHSPAYCALG